MRAKFQRDKEDGERRHKEELEAQRKRAEFAEYQARPWVGRSSTGVQYPSPIPPRPTMPVFVAQIPPAFNDVPQGTFLEGGSLQPIPQPLTSADKTI